MEKIQVKRTDRERGTLMWSTQVGSSQTVKHVAKLEDAIVIVFLLLFPQPREISWSLYNPIHPISRQCTFSIFANWVAAQTGVGWLVGWFVGVPEFEDLRMHSLSETLTVRCQTLSKLWAKLLQINIQFWTFDYTHMYLKYICSSTVFFYNFVLIVLVGPECGAVHPKKFFKCIFQNVGTFCVWFSCHLIICLREGVRKKTVLFRT